MSSMPVRRDISWQLPSILSLLCRTVSDISLRTHADSDTLTARDSESAISLSLSLNSSLVPLATTITALTAPLVLSTTFFAHLPLPLMLPTALAALAPSTDSCEFFLNEPGGEACSNGDGAFGLAGVSSFCHGREPPSTHIGTISIGTKGSQCDSSDGESTSLKNRGSSRAFASVRGFPEHMTSATRPLPFLSSVRCLISLTYQRVPVTELHT
mmetsp:Transcript_30232/g.74072  ORF Transcript_30232/g.74072 Transcript_30232/m.74072 type:complete len:213 (-) Transcript_30232:941-1579(-)